MKRGIRSLVRAPIVGLAGVVCVASMEGHARAEEENVARADLGRRCYVQRDCPAGLECRARSCLPPPPDEADVGSVVIADLLVTTYIIVGGAVSLAAHKGDLAFVFAPTGAIFGMFSGFVAHLANRRPPGVILGSLGLRFGAIALGALIGLGAGLEVDRATNSTPCGGALGPCSGTMAGALIGPVVGATIGFGVASLIDIVWLARPRAAPAMSDVAIHFGPTGVAGTF